ncbi:MAG: DMT family transporter [Candidatus Tectomicrobia bacterium]|nr:DMT family transporter [Candidatus Tectomicrobia bacterium]
MTFPSAEVLALLTALGFAVSDVLMGAGIRTSTPYTGAVTLCFMVGLCGALALPWVWPSAGLNAAGVFWFLLVGISQSGLGMFFFYLSMRRVGVARAAVISASAPAFSVGLAVLFLSEEPTLFSYLGTAAIILGVMASVRGEKGRRENRRSLGSGDLVFPLLTAFLFGVSPLFRKVGLGHLPSVPLGTALAGAGGFASLLLLGRTFPRAERFRWEKRAAWLFFAGGLVMAGAQATLFMALRTGWVSVVVPLVYVKPLFVSAIVSVTGRGRESVGTGVFVGGVLMAVGAWLLLGFR